MLRFKEFLLEVGLSFREVHPKMADLEDRLRGSSDFESDEHRALSIYDGGSKYINPNLINYHNNGLEPPRSMPSRVGVFDLPALDAATSKPFNRSFVMYSGLGFNPREHMRGDGRILMPAYTSGSLDKGVAGSYMKHIDKDGYRHILRIQVRHNDTGASMSPISTRVHEIILPRNMVLHIRRSEVDPEDSRVIVHHAVIDHEVEPGDFRKEPRLGARDRLMDKIRVGEHSRDDIESGLFGGYLVQDHLDELSKRFMARVRGGDVSRGELEDAHGFGYMSREARDILSGRIMDRLGDGDIDVRNRHDLSYDLDHANRNGYMNEKLRERLSDPMMMWLGTGGSIREGSGVEDHMHSYLSSRMKGILSGRLAEMIRRGHHTRGDLRLANEYGYMGRGIRKLLSDRLLREIEKGSDVEMGLNDAYKYGYMGNDVRGALRGRLLSRILRGEHNEKDLHLSHAFEYLSSDIKKAHIEQIRKKPRRFDIIFARKLGYLPKDLEDRYNEI